MSLNQPHDSYKILILSKTVSRRQIMGWTVTLEETIQSILNFVPVHLSKHSSNSLRYDSLNTERFTRPFDK